MKIIMTAALALAALASAALADELVELTDAQMDEITAGAVNGARGHFLGDYMGRLRQGSSRVAIPGVNVSFVVGNDRASRNAFPFLAPP